MVEVKVSFLAYVKRFDLFNVKCAFNTAGADIISLNFPEISRVWNFKVHETNDNKNQNREICVKFNAELEDKDFAEVRRGFDKCGAEIIGEDFPELWDIGYFNVERVE